jgi:hypothetical protein
MLNQIIKGHFIALHNSALLAKENDNLRTANKKKRQKRTRSKRQIAHGGLSIEEGLQLAQQPIQPVEANKEVSHREVDLPNQPVRPARRAPPTCSGCGQIGHRITSCKNRII